MEEEIEEVDGFCGIKDDDEAGRVVDCEGDLGSERSDGEEFVELKSGTSDCWAESW